MLLEHTVLQDHIDSGLARAHVKLAIAGGSLADRSVVKSPVLTDGGRNFV